MVTAADILARFGHLPLAEQLAAIKQEERLTVQLCLLNIQLARKAKHSYLELLRNYRTGLNRQVRDALAVSQQPIRLGRSQSARRQPGANYSPRPGNSSNGSNDQ